MALHPTASKAEARKASEVAEKAAKDVAALRDKLAADAVALRAKIQNSDMQTAQCEEVAALLAGLPERTQRDVMVPLGSAAFIPGRISNASKCLVRVGSNLLVERTADEARKSLLRRAAALQAEGEAAAGELASLTRRMEVAEAAVLAPLQAAANERLVDICEEYDEALHGPVRPESRVDLTTKAAPGKGSQGVARAHPAPRSAAQWPAVVDAAEEGPGMLSAGAARSAAEADRDTELFARMDALARCEAEAEGLVEDDDVIRTGGEPGSGAGAPSRGATETPAEVGPGPPATAQQGPGGPVRAQARSAPPRESAVAAKPGAPVAASPGLRRGFLGARPVRSAAPPAQPSGAAVHARDQSRPVAEQGASPDPEPGVGSGHRSNADALPGARPGAVVERAPAARMRAVTEGYSPNPGPRHAPGPAAQGGRELGAAGAPQRLEAPPGAPRSILKQAQGGGTAIDAPAERPVSRFKQLRQARGGI